MKIICIGHNYIKHIVELGNSIPEKPIFFMKPDTALLRNNDTFYIPDFSKDLHYETELVVKINRIAKSIDKKFAHRCYNEVGLGIDFTARDVQREYSAKGLPWELAKAFDHSAAISPQFIDKSLLPGIQSLDFSLDINGIERQHGNTSDMLFGVDDIIAYVTQFVTLKIGDLIFTGTPVGVGAVQPSDHLEGYLEQQKLLDFWVK